VQRIVEHGGLSERGSWCVSRGGLYILYGVSFTEVVTGGEFHRAKPYSKPAVETQNSPPRAYYTLDIARGQVRKPAKPLPLARRLPYLSPSPVEPEWPHAL